MKDFLQWMSTDGQKLTEQLQYATLPSQIVGPMDLWHINTRLCFTLQGGKESNFLVCHFYELIWPNPLRVDISLCFCVSFKVEVCQFLVLAVKSA